MLQRVALLLLAACGPKPAPTSTPGAEAQVPAPAYAALFQQGASWRYVAVVSTEGTHPETMEEVSSSTEEEVTCTVDEVVPFQGGVASAISCTPGASHDPIAGAWAAVDSGLYRISALPVGAPPELRPHDWVIPASPVAKREDFADPAQPTAVGTVEIALHGEDWCSEQTFTGAHFYAYRVCFGPDGTITSASHDSDGATTQSTSFTLVP